MELVFKLFLTALVLFFFIGSLRWIWFSQIDPKETMRLFLSSPAKSPEWVAMRDPSKIYQHGKEVGNLNGAVIPSQDQLIFTEICDTEAFNTTEPFEYKRTTYRVVSIGGRIGMAVGADDQGGLTSRKAVMTDVVCEVWK